MEKFATMKLWIYMQKKTYQTQFSMEVVVRRNFQRGQNDFWALSLPSLVPWMSFTGITVYLWIEQMGVLILKAG